MNTDDIKTDISILTQTIADKGWREPNVELTITADRFRLLLQAKHPISDDYKDNLWEVCGGDDYNEAWRKAHEYITTLTTTEEAATDAFRKALARTIETGKQVGIDTDFLNPLIAQMKRLSENIITDQTPPDTMSEEAERPWDTDISGSTH